MNKQLFEKQANSYNPIFPLVRLEDIIETISDKSIQWILNNYNHIYVEYSESVAITRNKVPHILRRTGIWISYNNGKEVVTEYYKGDNKDVTNYAQWTDNANWKKYSDLPDGTINYNHLSESLKQLFTDKVDVVNYPDEEDLTTDGTFLRFKDRKYEPHTYSGLGRVILRKRITIFENEVKNVLTQDMINKSNTIYEIRYDFDLNDAEITIPEGCVLQFEGGSFSNGTIVGRNTIIQASLYKIFGLDIEISGNWNVAEAYPEWFGAVGNGVYNESVYLQKVIDEFGYVINLNKKTYLVEELRTKSNVTIKNGTIHNSKNWPECFIMTGDNVTIEDVKFIGIKSSLRALICLHELSNGTIQNCSFDTDNGVSDVFAIYCSTKANNINIDKCIFGNVSYGILFDDMSEKHRLFDGVQYTDSIGCNLFIRYCKFLKRTLAGDGIEINTPIKSFVNVIVENCIFENTKKSHNTGLSIGFAKVDNVRVQYCRVLNSEDDGIHLEDDCQNSVISKNYIGKCYRGINLGSGCNIIVEDNIIEDCSEAITIFTNKPADGYSIVNNRIKNTKTVVFILQHLINSWIANNYIYSDLSGYTNSIITTLEVEVDGNLKSAENNLFFDNKVKIVNGGNCTFISGNYNESFKNNIFKNNRCIGNVSQNLITEKAWGINNRIEDNFGIPIKGKLVLTDRNLTNYALAENGNMSMDIVNGIIYVNSGDSSWLPYGFINSAYNRPVIPESIKSYVFFDTNLNIPIWWTGSKWVDATGADV